MSDENIPTPEVAVAVAAEEALPVESKSRFSLRDLAGKAGEVTSKAATKVGQLKEQAANKAEELKDASFAKLNETLDDFNAAIPIVREAGYRIGAVGIEIGIPPKITADFSVSDDVSEENVERLLVAHADKKLATLLLKALYQAWRVQMKIKIAGLQPKGIAVEIGLIPTVSVKFA